LKALTILFFAAFTAFVHAEDVDLKGVSTGEEGTQTTIEIKKGKPGEIKTDNKWELTDGTADVEGDAGATASEAKSKWKKSCEDWKKEIKEQNKDNKVISVNCGTATCGGEAGSKTCTSKASYKIKTKVN
jgi:hypothetical protein